MNNNKDKEIMVMSKMLDVFKKQWNEMNEAYKNTENKIGVFVQYRNFLTALSAIATIVLGFLGMLELGQSPTAAIMNTLQLFALNIPDNAENSYFVFLAFLFAATTVFLVAVMFFFKEYLEKRIIQTIFQNKHTVLFGLSSVTRNYLDSIGKNRDKNIIIMESDPKNQYIETYKQNDFSVVIANAFASSTLKSLNFNTMQYAIISIGEDRQNIELAKIIINYYEESKTIENLKLLIHVRSRELSYLFYENFISTTKLNIEIKTFSFYEEVSDNLFEKHFIDGDSLEYIQNDKSFCSVVMGDGELLRNVLYKMIELSNLPNENKHTVYIVDRDADSLVNRMKKYLFYTPQNFPTFELVPYAIDLDLLEYADDTIWKMQNLVNVIICYDEEKRNLDRAIELYNRVYIGVENEKQPKVLFAMYNEMLLSKTINKDQSKFKNFYTFGEAGTILCHKNLIDEENEKIAKLVHYGYGDIYEKRKTVFENKKQDVDTKWYNTAKFSDKLSNRSQAKHIDIKLKALGLKKAEAKDKDVKELLAHNIKVVYGALEGDFKEIELSEEMILEHSQEVQKYYDGKEYKVVYFPQQFTTMFEKLIRAEHNRWNSYHFLNGWKLNTIKDKDRKIHNCLVPLKNFKAKDIQVTILYDVYSILYIPNYLAETQYKIVGYDC